MGIAVPDQKSHFPKINGKLHANSSFIFFLIPSQRIFNRTKMQIHNFSECNCFLDDFRLLCIRMPYSFWVVFSPRSQFLQYTNLTRIERISENWQFWTNSIFFRLVIISKFRLLAAAIRTNFNYVCSLTFTSCNCLQILWTYAGRWTWHIICCEFLNAQITFWFY